MRSTNPAEQFSGRRYICLESYKRDGNPKLTPVQSIEDNGLVYFRTDPRTWKVKRIKRDSRVRISLSDRSGRPTSEWFNGVAEVVEGEEGDRIDGLFRREYGTVGNLIVGLVARLRGERLTTVVSVRLQPLAGTGMAGAQ